LTTTAIDFKFQNQTRGLFGNWSGNVEDDFQLPDGSTGPQANTNNFDTMHRQFGVYCKYAAQTLWGSEQGIKDSNMASFPKYRAGGQHGK